MINPEGKLLGKKVDHPKCYTPEILVAVPRQLNREEYNIKADNLPFIGFDIWHAYEMGFLTNKRLPVAGVLKLSYSCSSEFIVESKSLKLYMNSFNMETFGSNPSEGIEKVLDIIKQDLEKLLLTNVELAFFQNQEDSPFDFLDYEVLESQKKMQEVTFDSFTENPKLLLNSDAGNIEIKVATHLLRSNCKITHQPDWGSAYIHIETLKPIDQVSLLKYLVSFRNENHFHEEICEMIYKRLWDVFKPSKLMVSCLYTRRGGIDICPARASSEELLPSILISSKHLTKRSLRQ
ncbi:NADPH-dependent 7-cyano-7-deazaguanine reductase QueF [bacterium]|nr:NADPH-dependent 7-cyano-7-deazaguanine reductase QueF [bacterium]